MSRASYARARRRKDTPQEAKLRPALEKVAKKVYKTASPVVKKVVNTGNLGKDFKDPDPAAYKKGTMPVVNRAVSAVGSGMQKYLKTTQSIADKLKPALMKLPKPPQRHRRPAPRIRKRMEK